MPPSAEALGACTPLLLLLPRRRGILAPPTPPAPPPPPSAPAVKYYNPVSNLCAIRCSRDEYRQVRVWLRMAVEMQLKARLVATASPPTTA